MVKQEKSIFCLGLSRVIHHFGKAHQESCDPWNLSFLTIQLHQSEFVSVTFMVIQNIGGGFDNFMTLYVVIVPKIYISDYKFLYYKDFPFICPLY